MPAMYWLTRPNAILHVPKRWMIWRGRNPKRVSTIECPMILNQDNEYTALLDACVLVPMCLCDTLLRLAEDPAMYRPLWSQEILQEVGDALESKIGLSLGQRQRRIGQMAEAFPEASVQPASCLAVSLDGIPDEGDRHVLATAIAG